MIKAYKTRKTSVEVCDFFLKRHSSRALDPDKEISSDVLNACFEAARFSPSCYNNQPWRYLMAKKGSKAFEAILSSMVEFNQLWAKNAQVLIIVITKTLFEHNQKISQTAPFDTGLSCMSFLIQAHHHGLIAHAMAGFSKKALIESFQINPPFEIQCLLAVGYPGDVHLLPEDIKEKEELSMRKNLDEIVCQDLFRFT